MYVSKVLESRPDDPVQRGQALQSARRKEYTRAAELSARGEVKESENLPTTSYQPPGGRLNLDALRRSPEGVKNTAGFEHYAAQSVNTDPPMIEKMLLASKLMDVYPASSRAARDPILQSAYEANLQATHQLWGSQASVDGGRHDPIMAREAGILRLHEAGNQVLESELKRLRETAMAQREGTRRSISELRKEASILQQQHEKSIYAAFKGISDLLVQPLRRETREISGEIGLQSLDFGRESMFTRAMSETERGARSRSSPVKNVNLPLLAESEFIGVNSSLLVQSPFPSEPRRDLFSKAAVEAELPR